MYINPDKASAYFASGYNCAESMLLASCDALKISCEYFPRIASCVGAGLSLDGEACGIATGGLLAIGLLTGRVRPEDSNDIAYYYGSLYMEKFRELRGSHLCRDITKTDFTKIEGLNAWTTEKIPENICIPLMREAVEILSSILEEIQALHSLQKRTF